MTKEAMLSDRKFRIRRRALLLGAAAAVAGAGVGRNALAAPNLVKRRLIKIGLVAPFSGPLAALYQPFGPFIIDQIKRHLGPSISIQGTRHPYEIIVKDAESDPNRASEVAQHLIFGDHADIITAISAPTVVNPVANQCEANGVPCIGTANPLESFYFGRGAPKNGFEWTYDFFFSFHEVDHAVVAEWNHIATNKKVGVMWPNDADGQGDSRTLPPILKKHAYELINPGMFDPTTSSFTAQIANFKARGVEIVDGIMSPPHFITFWNECFQQGFHPKIVRIAKSTEFVTVVEPLGRRAVDLSVEVTWSPVFPYKSGLTGISCPDLARTYEEATHREWVVLLGYPHALMEVAFHALRTAHDIDRPASIRDAIRTMKYHSIVGPLDFSSGPFPNTSQTPVVIGQWRKGAKFPLDLVVTDNSLERDIPVQAKPLPILYS